MLRNPGNGALYGVSPAQRDRRGVSRGPAHLIAPTSVPGPRSSLPSAHRQIVPPRCKRTDVDFVALVTAVGGRSSGCRWSQGRRRPAVGGASSGWTVSAGSKGGRADRGSDVSGRKRVPDEPWRSVYAVRRDWPVDGTHEFVGLSGTAAEAGWYALADRSYWRRGPVRPTHSVVQISRHDFRLHGRRRSCRAPDCPTTILAASEVSTVDGVG
jgi:hypothetical protein